MGDQVDFSVTQPQSSDPPPSHPSHPSPKKLIMILIPQIQFNHFDNRDRDDVILRITWLRENRRNKKSDKPFNSQDVIFNSVLWMLHISMKN